MRTESFSKLMAVLAAVSVGGALVVLIELHSSVCEAQMRPPRMLTASTDAAQLRSGVVVLDGTATSSTAVLANGPFVMTHAQQTYSGGGFVRLYKIPAGTPCTPPADFFRAMLILGPAAPYASIFSGQLAVLPGESLCAEAGSSLIYLGWSGFVPY